MVTTVKRYLCMGKLIINFIITHIEIKQSVIYQPQCRVWYQPNCIHMQNWLDWEHWQHVFFCHLLGNVVWWRTLSMSSWRSSGRCASSWAALIQRTWRSTTSSTSVSRAVSAPSTSRRAPSRRASSATSSASRASSPNVSILPSFNLALSSYTQFVLALSFN